MTMRFAESTLQGPSRQKRPQKYMGFALQPGDQELLDALPAHQREILLSKGNYKEMAESFGVAVGTIRSRLHRARAALTALRQGHAARQIPGQTDNPIN